MRNFTEALYFVALTAWIGGMWAIGYVVAPTLFATLGDRQLAGLVAGRLFAVMGWIGLGCGAYMLGVLLVRLGGGALKRSVFWLTLVILVLIAVGQFGIQPLMVQLKAEAWPRDVMETVLRDRFAAWHGISSILYLVQSVLGLWLVVSASRGLK